MASRTATGIRPGGWASTSRVRNESEIGLRRVTFGSTWQRSVVKFFNSKERRKISENFSSLNPLIYVGRRVFILIGLWLGLGLGQNPPANAKKEYVEKRAAILRQMAEIKAKLSALDLELQLLEESRTADPAAAPPTSWREEPGVAADGAAKKPSVRCLSVTGNGKRCSRPAGAGGKYCWQHRLH